MKSRALKQLLVERRETLEVEIKNWLGGLKDNTSKAKLAREIIALANSDGGYIIIGFSDDDGHPEELPSNGEDDGFTYDAIMGVVERYIEPACQIKVDRVETADLQVAHPIITVHGNHRTPIWAKKGAEDSDILKNNTVYIRRSGAHSEPPRSQDDWEKLIDRLVKARQSEIVSAVRTVLNPELSHQQVDKSELLTTWIQESYQKWQMHLADLSEHDPRKFEKGYWTAAFWIDGFQTKSLGELLQHTQNEMNAYSGWRPFLCSMNPGQAPIPGDRSIDAWLGFSGDKPINDFVVATSDYWRLSQDGYGYLTRPFQEDDPGYCDNRAPRPIPPNFDVGLHAYRVAEILRVIESLGNSFSSTESLFQLRMIYTGMKGRKLESWDFGWAMASRGNESKSDVISHEVSAPISQIGTNMEEIIVELLDPVYEKFNFSKVIPGIVAEAVKFVS